MIPPEFREPQGRKGSCAAGSSLSNIQYPMTFRGQELAQKSSRVLPQVVDKLTPNGQIPKA